jgi:chromosomal replication initiator protein
MEDPAVWLKIKEEIKKRIGATAFETWFGPTRCVPAGGNAIVIEAPDTFFRDWLSKHYLSLICEIAKGLHGEPLEIQLRVNPDLLKTQDQSRFAAFEQKLRSQPEDQLTLNSRYSFANFVEGDSNRFAHAASLAVAQSPAKAYNPLFIYGGVGLGKTHLIQAICHFARSLNQGLKICYLPSERFTNELINAIQHRSTQAFRQKYRNVDILVIDDIHFIAGKESTQEEFFHTFNALYDAHKQIIISSDRSPRDIAHMEERLVSRFGWGLITDIQPPNFETRVAILRKKMEGETIQVPDEIIQYIAGVIKTNIRELEGALIRVVAYSLLEEKSITIDLAKDVLKDMVKESVKQVTVDLIQKYTAQYFNLSLIDFKNKRRSRHIVLARQVAMYISRVLTKLSLPEIGEYFGGKDHTTVLYAYNKIQEKIKNNEGFKQEIERLIKEIQQ